MHTHLRKNKLGLQSAKDVLRGVSENYKVSESAHDRLHGPLTIVWTSKATLAVEQSTPLKMPRGGQIVGIVAKVAGAPSGGALTLQLLLDGTAVTESDISIASGDTVSRERIVTNPYFQDDTVWKFSITAVNGATGPVVVTVEYLPGW